MLAGWGYRLGRDDDQLLPMVACQVLLLNRSPHLEDAEHRAVRADPPRAPAARAQGNTLHAMQRAVAELGFCDPPQPPTGRHSARASGGAPAWAAVGRPLARHFHAHAPGPRRRPRHPAQGRAMAGGRASRGRATQPAGRGRPARPGSPRWTGCRSATTPSAPPACRTALASRWRQRRRRPSSARCGPSSGTARSGSGYPGASTLSARWPPRAASPPCSARTPG